MISPAATLALETLRRVHRPKPAGVASPTKRPPGGRPNPCADLPSWESRPILTGRRNRRNQQLGGNDAGPPWRRFVAAVAAGKLPVGQPVTGAMMSRAIGNLGGNYGGWPAMSCDLAANHAPCRLRCFGSRGTKPSYRIDLV